jgi:hypothetical protein
MRRVLAFAITMALAAAVLVWAQRPGEPERGEAQRGEAQHPAQPAHNQPRANQGHVPPAPQAREAHTAPEPERRNGRVNEVPHVANDRWYGHDRPNDARYHLDHPYPHGRFARFGPSYRYNIVRFDPNLHRFWLPGGFFFEIAAFDWPLASDWCWNCGGDDFVIYDDPDHPGWYLLYNVHTGGYVHVQYLGT